MAERQRRQVARGGRDAGGARCIGVGVMWGNVEVIWGDVGWIVRSYTVLVKQSTSIFCVSRMKYVAVCDV